MSTSGQMLDWLDRDLAWKEHGRPLCAICDEPAEFVVESQSDRRASVWYPLRHLRRGALPSNDLEPRCADHSVCVLPHAVRWNLAIPLLGLDSPTSGL